MSSTNIDKTQRSGVALHCDITGSGDPVLLISNGPIVDSFLPFVSQRALADHHRLIRYRQRRLATGTRNPEPVSFVQHAADAAALLGQLGIRRAHVAGHSTGAAIALQLAVDRPEMVHSLVLLEPPLMSVPSAGAFFEAAGPALAAFGAGDHEGAMARFMSMVSSMDWEACRAHVEANIPGSVALAIKDADNFFGSYLPALSTWQFGAKEAATISQPVLSVLGTQSERLFAEGHALLHTWFPQLENYVIEEIGHLLQMQRPDPVARGMAEFFARHPVGKARHEVPPNLLTKTQTLSVQ